MKALLVIGSIVAALATAGVAGAAGQGGAYVYSTSTCSSTPFGLICFDEKAVTNVTETRSGNMSYVTNGRIDVSFTQPLTGCTSSTSQSFHTHWEDKDGEAQSRGERYSFTTQIACSGSVQTCLTTVAFHYGRDDIQFDRTDVVCTSE